MAALPVTAETESTLYEYLATAVSGKSEAFPVAARGDSGVVFTGLGSYDLVYRQQERNSDGTHAGIDAYRGKAGLAVSRVTSGFFLESRGILVNGEWKDDEAGASAVAQSRDGTVAGGGWFGGGRIRFFGLLSSNPRYCFTAAVRNFHSGKGRAEFFNSPALGVTAGVRLLMPRFTASVSYENGSLENGFIKVRNTSNNAYRKLQLSLDENCARLYFNSEGLFSIDGKVYLYSKGWIDNQPSVLPMEVSGGGFSLKSRIFLRRLHFRPEFDIELKSNSYALKGYDREGETCLRLDEHRTTLIRAVYRLKPGKFSEAGVFGMHFTSRAKNGLIALYPFTNWLFILDLPDRLKMYSGELIVTEAGFLLSRKRRITGNRAIQPSIAVSCCKIEGYVETAEQVRYMVLFPVYENHTTTRFADNMYAVFKLGLQYEKQVGANVLHIKAQQVVPVEVTAMKNGEERGGGDEKQKSRMYGGFRVEWGIEVGGGGGAK